MGSTSGIYHWRAMPICIMDGVDVGGSEVFRAVALAGDQSA